MRLLDLIALSLLVVTAPAEDDAEHARASLVSFLALSEDPTNCTLGDPRRDVHYVTTASSLYRIQTAVRGREGLPGK